MELIDAYVSEVGRRLPEKMRADIERELRSTVEDTLEDESRVLGQAVDEAMVVEALKKLGAPEQVAASYLPPRYLVGPELYSSFILTLRVVLSIVASLGLVGMGISLGVSAGEPVEVIKTAAQSFAGVLNSLVQAAGVVVVIFALIQWVSPRWVARRPAFDPLKIRLKSERERINPTGLMVEIVLTFMALAIFNLYPQYVGLGTLREGQWVIVGVLSPAFFAILPWLSLIWAASGFLKIFLLVQGRWTSVLHLLSLAIDVFSIGLIYRMITGPGLVQFPSDLISRLGMGTATPEFIANPSTFTNIALQICLIFALFGECVQAVQMIFRIFRQMRAPAVFG